MPLKKYQSKRTFNKTPEPQGLESPTNQQRFVIQKHDATNLHYDLRLEYKGVMLSWAVPKGPSLDPNIKHLAAQVEDHPLEYRNFEGVIPEGYGAGTVMIWDQGTFEWVRRDNKVISFVLNGQKLKGEFALVRLPRAGAKAWLMIKAKKDRFAKRSPSIINSKPASVVTGRNLQEIAQGKPMIARLISKLERAIKKKMPARISVMKPTLIEKPFSDVEWLFETKWDGFRGLAFIDGKKMKLLSRNNHDLLARFPSLKTIGDGLAARHAVIDGEIIAADSKGVGRFSWLKEARGKEITYKAFDLLYLDGYDLTKVPLAKRKALLRAIMIPHPLISFGEYIEGAGEKYFSEMAKLGHEGIIAKEINSSYEQGKRTRTWLKIKNVQQQEFVIGGWQAGKGARSGTIGNLVLGVYYKGKLRHVGKVGTGFDSSELTDLKKRFASLARKKSPFSKPLPGRSATHYLSPQLVAQIKFAEWTPDGYLRQPVYLGLRSDKQAKEVTQEIPHSIELSAPQTAKHHNGSKIQLNPKLIIGTKKSQTIKIAGQELKLSNPQKKFWTKPLYLKSDMLNYYYQIAPVLLNHLKDRPLSLKRYPNGAKGSYFFQKHAPKPHPRFVDTITIKHSGRPTQYVMCNDVETLVWLANLADLEMHPWYSRKGSLNKPDFVVFDLDPTKENDLKGIREVALMVKDALDNFNLKSYPKSSGSRGIHIYVPVTDKVSYDDTRFFAKKITEIVHRTAPRKTTLEFRKAKRHGVYIDYLQNIKGKTLASAYSLRARPYAAVSAPLTWKEVAKGFRMRDFNIKSIISRLARQGDLFHDTLTLKQNLRGTLRRIGKMDI